MQIIQEFISCLNALFRILTVYLAIQDDRKSKTLRIRMALSQIVGYRECKLFSRKSGVSDCTISEILEGKKDMAGYDVINRLELFLSRIMPDFELSIENTLTIKNGNYI